MNHHPDVSAMIDKLIASRSPWDLLWRIPSMDYWVRGATDPKRRLYAAGWKPCFVVSEDETCTTTRERVDGWTYG